MSLLTDASLLLTPNANATSKVYSIIPTNGNGDFTATRATTATRVNSSGLIESAAINMIRRDYSLGGCPNILLEPQRTNLALQSSSFDNASWTKNAVSVTANTTTSPSGIVDADTLTADGTLNFHEARQSVSVTSGTTYSWSVYAKKNTNNFIQLVPSGGIFGTNVWANFDLNSGTVGTVGSSTTASIQNAGNGWYRCTITGAATATASGTVAAIIVTSATATRGENNTLTTSVFLWGAQLEAGAYATSYIPTTTASVTRNADSITRNNIYTNGLITSAGGTWFVELRNNRVLAGDANGDSLHLGVSANVNDNCIRLNSSTIVGRIIIFKRIGGVTTNLFGTTTDNVKLAFKWNGSTMDIFQNGIKVVGATSFTETNMQVITNNVNAVTKFINEMALFPTPLTDAQCIALTA